MKTKGHPCRIKIMVAVSALVALLSSGARAEEVKLELVSSGAMPKLGGYIPQRLQLSSDKPEGLKKEPEALAAPLYGELRLGPSETPTTFFVVVDEPVVK